MSFARPLFAVALTFLYGTSAFAIDVTIRSLECKNQHEVASKDEIFVEVFVDGQKSSKSFMKEMGRGDTFSIEETFSFNSDLEVIVYDLDRGGKDRQKLGSASITAAGTDSKILDGFISGSKHEYLLRWK